MSKIISIIVALILGAALAVPMVASAAVGKAFLHGVNSPAELAGKIEASIVQNPKGMSMLDPGRCKRDGSCATPLNYLQAIQLKQKLRGETAILTDVTQVPGFLRKLERIDAPAGEYWISCLKPSGQGVYRVELHCLSRTFKPGGKVWVDPATKDIIFDEFCTNVVEKPVPPKQACVEIHFTTKPGDTIVRFGLLGPTDVKDDCIGVKRAGETEFEQWWKDECIVKGCDFSADSAVVGQPVRLVGSYIPVPGKHVLRLPALVAEKESLYVTVLCLERSAPGDPPKEPPKPVQGTSRETYKPAYDAYMTWRAEYEAWRNKWLVTHSDGMGIRPHTYRQTSSGIKTATVYYTQAEIPPGAPQLYIPWGEWTKMHPEALK